MSDHFDFFPAGQLERPTAKDLANQLDGMCTQKLAEDFYLATMQLSGELGDTEYTKFMREASKLETKGKGKDMEVIPSKAFPGLTELDFADNCPVTKSTNETEHPKSRWKDLEDAGKALTALFDVFDKMTRED